MTQRRDIPVKDYRKKSKSWQSGRLPPVGNWMKARCLNRSASFLLLFFSLLTGLAGAREAGGGDLEDLQASFQAEVNAFNAHQQNAFITSAHPDVVIYGTLSPDVIRGKAALQALIRDYFAAHANAFFSPIYTDFRVVGSVALAWGHYTLSDISVADLAKDGPMQISHGRYTFTYTKIDRTWQLVAMYFSPLQIFSPAASDTEKK